MKISITEQECFHEAHRTLRNRYGDKSNVDITAFDFTDLIEVWYLYFKFLRLCVNTRLFPMLIIPGVMDLVPDSKQLKKFLFSIQEGRAFYKLTNSMINTIHRSFSVAYMRANYYLSIKVAEKTKRELLKSKVKIHEYGKFDILTKRFTPRIFQEWTEYLFKRGFDFEENLLGPKCTPYSGPLLENSGWLFAGDGCRPPFRKPNKDYTCSLCIESWN